jgi:2'-5' RNA ligase
MTDLKPQGYAVELYFDHQMEDEIHAFRESIYRLGINPVLGKMKDRPHVSLAVFDEVDPNKLIQITSLFAKKAYQFPVQLEAIGMFPTPSNIVYLFPIPTIALLTLHRDFHQHLKKEKVNSSHYYLPGKWVPHCTLEFELSDEQFDLAVQLCKKHFSPIHGRFASLGVIAFRPSDYLAEFVLPIQE